MKNKQESTQEYQHQPVLLEEVCAYAPLGARLVVDATLGGAGHATALLTRLPFASLWGCDRDASAIAVAKTRLAKFGQRVQLKQLRFSQLGCHLIAGSVDYLVADLGMSSAQLADGKRGFSFQREGPLDMRMDQHTGRLATDFLATASKQELQKVFSELGEERFSARIAEAITQRRKQEPLLSTGQLVRLIEEVVPKKVFRPGCHVATRVFQSLRIYVNQELEELAALLEQGLELLATKGRLAIISFHSLEDRQVKQALRKWEKPCQCPTYLPFCICDKQPLGKIMTKKAVFAKAKEVSQNPRSRSARLRVFELS